MKIDLPNMDFEIPSIPDPHFEPKINYKALEEMSKSRDEYLTTLRNAILSIDKQQQEAVKQMELQAADTEKKHKQTMRWTRWAFVVAFLTLIATLCSLFFMLRTTGLPNKKTADLHRPAASKKTADEQNISIKSFLPSLDARGAVVLHVAAVLHGGHRQNDVFP